MVGTYLINNGHGILKHADDVYAITASDRISYSNDIGVQEVALGENYTVVLTKANKVFMLGEDDYTEVNEALEAITATRVATGRGFSMALG